MSLISIAVGGALGAVARWGLGGWVHGWAGAAFPWGTFAVNVVGSFLLGFSFLYLESVSLPAELRRFIAIGFLGAFTTFSTFAYESVALLRDGEWARAGGYVAASVVLGLAGVIAGFGAARALLHVRS